MLHLGLLFPLQLAFYTILHLHANIWNVTTKAFMNE